MTDARHDSTKNAHHTTVPSLSGRYDCVYMVCNVLITYLYSTKKIVDVCTLSRKEHSTAQIRELACTKEVLSNVTSRVTQCPVCSSDYPAQGVKQSVVHRMLLMYCRPKHN